jgi:hypothetical protein
MTAHLSESFRGRTANKIIRVFKCLDKPISRPGITYLSKGQRSIPSDPDIPPVLQRMDQTIHIILGLHLLNIRFEQRTE